MRKGLLRVCISSVILTAASSSLFATTVFVGGMSNIFEAGLGTPGATVGPNMGFYPTLGASFNAGSGQTITFNSVGLTGETALCGTNNCTATSADGASGLAGNTTGTAVTSGTGISGITFGSREFFLIGVFLTNAAPTPGTQPATVTYVNGSGGYDPDGRANWFDSSTTYAIGQSFYVGDGKTGLCPTAGAACAGTTQTWYVPPTATALYLGFADGGSTGPFSGAFGAYNDNSGGFTVNINTSGLTAGTPEPSTLTMLGLGILGLGFLRKRLA
jgi:PEP-CTERM motif